MDNLNITTTLDFSCITPEEVKADIEGLISSANKGSSTRSLFTIQTANHWIMQAKGKPNPLMLFDVLFYEGELCILFADTNLGKSILAVQIGDSISTGEAITGFELEAPKQKILYFDFELSEKQFEIRYSVDFRDSYKFDDNFFRAEINPDTVVSDDFSSFEDYLNYSIEDAIKRLEAKVLIIDNLTYLKNETEKAKDALPLMKQLKALQHKYGLSVLVLAHTPKRDLTKPITRNDLSGSKMLMNFCDSAFAIGESHVDKNVRYIKQIKARNTEIKYDAENVILCQVNKAYNFLQFEFLQYGTEREHLKQQTEKDKTDFIEKVVALKQQGLSLREIGVRLGVSHMTVRRTLDGCNSL